MSNYREIIKESTISHRVHIRCIILVPDVYGDENAAPAMGACPSEKMEGIEKFVEEILAPQYFNAMRSIISKFECSLLPDDLIYKQKVRLEPLGRGLTGVYDRRADIIIEDLDTSVIRDRGPYIFGHEFGHKLLKFKHKEAVEHALWEIAGIVGISNKNDLKEILCDGVGNVLTQEHKGTHVLPYELPQIKIEGIEKTALRLAWAI